MEKHITVTETGEAILAWVGCRCSACDWNGKAEVTQRDKKGNLLVRCPECGERIPIEIPEPAATTEEVK